MGLRLIMRRDKLFFLLLIILLLPSAKKLFAQDQNYGQHKILYYQMQPFDDSLFIKIQKEVFIDPPDPKAEIIVDLRDPNNQTVSIKGTLYPFLAFKPATRAKIVTYPFKLDLEQNITYTSVFTKEFGKMSFRKLFSPPSAYQISSTLAYINPFLQLEGGERFGIPIKGDLGFSAGIGTPYSGPLETNFMEAEFHILGFSIGEFGSTDSFTKVKQTNNHNNLYATNGFQISYVLPFGNFFKVGYLSVQEEPTQSQLESFHKYDIDSLGYHAKVLHGKYYNWEFRYPISVLGSTRGKFYVARYLNEWHIGFTGRELSLAGNTFDFSFDAMPKSDVRQPQYVMNILVQRIAANWAFSAFAVGPSIIFSKRDNGQFGVTSIFLNARIKVGTSL